ncbi:MAG: acetylxylan esterase [Verrucomicrobiales bacterium]|nr:acetylxylan esterase [Verrucomicrobiales bacterium]
MARIFLSCLLLLLSAAFLPAEEYVPIYDEKEVPEYTLPDPLVFENGEKVETAADWWKRRAELLRLFSHHVYGKTLQGTPEGMHFESTKKLDSFLGGKATLEEIRIHFSEGSDGPFLDLLLIKPKEVPEAGVPTFVALNFRGNHSIHPSPEIALNQNWVSESSSDRKAGVVVEHKATEKARGFRSSRWPVEMIIDSGAALATFYYGDVDPDFHDEFKNGVHEPFGVPGKGDWGSIGAWAWATSRVRDFLESDEQVDQGRVAVFGHSRLGKTALWAGAQDDRFALTISNNSGCGGAALSRRRFGERVSRINNSFPHWFCENFRQYNENESSLPVDQHQLIALIAPRRVYVASAEGDEWADPRGEFLSVKHASPVFELLGKAGIAAESLPGLHEPVGGEVRYHIRAGKHDVTDYDWEQYLKAIHSLP